MRAHLSQLTLLPAEAAFAPGLFPASVPPIPIFGPFPDCPFCTVLIMYIEELSDALHLFCSAIHLLQSNGLSDLSPSLVQKWHSGLLADPRAFV